MEAASWTRAQNPSKGESSPLFVRTGWISEAHNVSRYALYRTGVITEIMSQYPRLCEDARCSDRDCTFNVQFRSLLSPH